MTAALLSDETRSSRRSPTIRAARDLSVEIAKAKATGAEALMVVSRANDAILLTREMVKQRWSPMAILSMGPGWNENDYFKTLGKLADGPMSFIPWYDPTKKLAKQLIGALAKSYPDINMDEKHFYTFEALLIAADAFKRAGTRRSQGTSRCNPDDQHYRQHQYRPRHPVQREGSERQAQECGHPKSRWQIRHHCAQGSVRCKARAANDAL